MLLTKGNNEMKKEFRLTVRIEKDMHEELRKKAFKTKVSIAFLIRHAIRNFLEEA